MKAMVSSLCDIREHWKMMVLALCFNQSVWLLYGEYSMCRNCGNRKASWGDTAVVKAEDGCMASMVAEEVLSSSQILDEL